MLLLLILVLVRSSSTLLLRNDRCIGSCRFEHGCRGFLVQNILHTVMSHSHRFPGLCTGMLLSLEGSYARMTLDTVNPSRYSTELFSLILRIQLLVSLSALPERHEIRNRRLTTSQQ